MFEEQLTAPEGNQGNYNGEICCLPLTAAIIVMGTECVGWQKGVCERSVLF